MNGGRKPTSGRDTNQTNRGARSTLTLSRRGPNQLIMCNIFHIPRGQGGMRKGGNEIIRERFPNYNYNYIGVSRFGFPATR